MRQFFLAVTLCLTLLGATACGKKPKPTATDAPAVGTSAVAPPETPAAEPPRGPKLGPRVPQGPLQMVLPGRGISALLFGATVATIERHQGAPCEIKTETSCIYVSRAMEFMLENGVMVRAKVHFLDHPVAGRPSESYGVFNGGMPPKIELGLHRHIVLEEYGAPLRTEEVPQQGGAGLVERHFYDGVILDYDKLKNGNVVLSGIEVYPSKTAFPAGPRAARK